jgi:hypothetical protein
MSGLEIGLSRRHSGPARFVNTHKGDFMRNDEEFEVGMVMHEIASATDTLWNLTVGQNCDLNRLGLPSLEAAWATLGAIIERAREQEAA